MLNLYQIKQHSKRLWMEMKVKGLQLTSFSNNAGFCVDGTSLLDHKGNVFIIRGINTPNAWAYDQCMTAFERISETGANAVRIVCNTKVHAYYLNKVLSKCKQYKMIAIPELHDVTGKDSAEELNRMAEFWASSEIKAILNKYKEYVILNVANEWGEKSDEVDWFHAYKKAIGTLREAGITHTLMIDANGWGQNGNTIIQKGADLKAIDPNLIFSVHMYGNWNDRNSIGTKLQRMLDQGLCVVVGEFGYDPKKENNLTCTVDAQEVMDQCQNKQIGYIPWSWGGNNLPNAWLDMTVEWGELTPWGELVINGKNGIRETSKRCTVFE